MAKRNPLPQELYSRAIVPGGPRARAWGDEPPHWTDKWFATPREELHAQYRGVVGCEHNYLALSEAAPTVRSAPACSQGGPGPVPAPSSRS
jgi:hypothetical protein